MAPSAFKRLSKSPKGIHTNAQDQHREAGTTLGQCTMTSQNPNGVSQSLCNPVGVGEEVGPPTQGCLRFAPLTLGSVMQPRWGWSDSSGCPCGNIIRQAFLFFSVLALAFLGSACSNIRGNVFDYGPSDERVDGVRVGLRNTVGILNGFDIGINNRVEKSFNGLAIDPGHRVRGKSTGLHLSFYSEVERADHACAQVGLANRCDTGDLIGQLGVFNFVGARKSERDADIYADGFLPRDGTQIGFVNQGDFANFGAKVGVLNITDHNQGFMLGAMNLTGASRGISLGVINEMARSQSGVQEGWCLGLLNHANRAKGGQFGLVNWLAAESDATQFGLYNVARDLKGVQIGLINTAPGLRAGSLQLGLLNLGETDVQTRGAPVLLRATF